MKQTRSVHLGIRGSKDNKQVGTTHLQKTRFSHRPEVYRTEAYPIPELGIRNNQLRGLDARHHLAIFF